MRLRWAPASPFARKVVVTAIETGQDAAIERVPTDVHAPGGDLHLDNPLGRVPALILDDGRVIIESSVICAYLDSRHDGSGLIPEAGAARLDALYLEALADGMTEAAIAVQRERGRPDDKRWPAWEARQWTKVERTLDTLEAGAALYDGPLTVGQIALGCALGWIEFRLGDKVAGWEATRPALAAWYRAFAERPAMRATAPR